MEKVSFTVCLNDALKADQTEFLTLKIHERKEVCCVELSGTVNFNCLMRI